MNTAYVQLKRSAKAAELMKQPECFMLLTQIAYRARRTGDFNAENLKIGEALVGDHEEIGLTRQEYRTALKKLEKWGMIAVKSTTKGSVVTLMDSEVYDINPEGTNHQATNGQPSSNHQATTNKNERKKELNNNSLEVLQQRFAQLEAANAALVSEVEALKEEKGKGATEPAEQPVAPASPAPAAEAKPAKARKPAPEPFVPPTEAEVKAEFVARTNVNGAISEKFAQVFTNHYALKDWTYGKAKVPLKDWKRAMSSAWDLPRFISENQHLAARSPNGAAPQSTQRARVIVNSNDPKACI